MGCSPLGFPCSRLDGRNADVGVDLGPVINEYELASEEHIGLALERVTVFKIDFRNVSERSIDVESFDNAQTTAGTRYDSVT